jgi:hypothetical protein
VLPPEQNALPGAGDDDARTDAVGLELVDRATQDAVISSDIALRWSGCRG